jgi:hypothetical protein
MDDKLVAPCGAYCGTCGFLKRERRDQVVLDAAIRMGILSGANAKCTLVQQAKLSIVGFAETFHVICS